VKRQDMIKSLNRLGLTKNQSALAVDAFFNAIVAGLREGKKVSIVGFGTWEWKKRAPRQARNPKTGKAVRLESRKVLLFKPSPGLKKKLKK